jgi:hypothetical protein
MECRRPSRDVPTPGSTRLAAAMRPLADARPLETCVAPGSDPTLWPAQCRSATSCHLDFGATVMILRNVTGHGADCVSKTSHQDATRLSSSIYAH